MSLTCLWSVIFSNVNKNTSEIFQVSTKEILKMDLIQSSEVSEVQQDLVRLNLKIRSKIESFLTVNSHNTMEKLNGDIRGNFEEMRLEISKLRQLAKKQEDSKSALMLKRDANNHEDQMTACLTAFKKANLSCIKRLESQGRDSLFDTGKNRKKIGKIISQKIRQSLFTFLLNSTETPSFRRVFF